MLRYSFIFLILCLFITISCDKASLDAQNSGEAYKLYVGDYKAEGSTVTRYRIGIDTITLPDTFSMKIEKITGRDSALFESNVKITNLLGLDFNDDAANVTYSRLYPNFPSNVKNLKIELTSVGVLTYSYYIPNGVNDTSRFKGVAKRQ